MSAIDDLIARARAAAEQLVQAQIENLPAVRSVRDATETLSHIEFDVREIGTDLVGLHTAGLLTQEDIHAFDQLRSNVKAAQTRLLAFVRNVFGNQPQVLTRLPTTTILAPPLSDAIYQSPPSQDRAQLPVDMAAWAVAGIIIAALIALGLLVYLGTKMYETFDGIVDLYVLAEQSRLLRALYDARRQALETCIQDRQRQGLETTECYGYAEQLVPTPNAALVPRAPPSSNAIWWFLGGLVTFGAVVGVGIYLAKASEKHSRLEGYREVSGDRLLKSRDDYNLEIDDA